jgi:hypothetical protein
VPTLNAVWRKSTHSNINGSCVEVRCVATTVQVRDTKDRDGAVLSFSTPAWRTFVLAVGGGEFDRP